jgi:hypothetical protein
MVLFGATPRRRALHMETKAWTNDAIFSLPSREWFGDSYSLNWTLHMSFLTRKIFALVALVCVGRLYMTTKSLRLQTLPRGGHV